MLFWSFGFVAAVATTMLAGRLDRWREAQWGGDIYVQRARTFHEAVVALAARLDKKERHA